MQSLTVIPPAAIPPTQTADAGARLYAAFLAGRSEHTLNAYAQDVAAFALFLGAGSPQAALAALLYAQPGDGNAMLLDYRSRMTEGGLTPATVNRRLAALRSAIKLGRTLGLTHWTPEIEGLRVQAYRDTHGPGLEGTRSMMGKAASQEDRVKAARDVALIRLMFDLGLRRGEVAGLNLDDLDGEGCRLWIKGKGRLQKEARSVPVPTLRALDDWLQLRGEVVVSDEQAVFVSLSGAERGHRITGRGLYHVISRIGQDVGLKTRPHGLRHASITAALDANGGDVRAVQQHARHSKPETTMRYDDNRKDLAGKIATTLADIL